MGARNKRSRAVKLSLRDSKGLFKTSLVNITKLQLVEDEEDDSSCDEKERFSSGFMGNMMDDEDDYNHEENDYHYYTYNVDDDSW